MAVALAGREAERRMLGDERISTGASNDIEKAVLLARRMVSEWGMLPDSSEAYLVSQQLKDLAVQQWLNRARQLAEDTLSDHHQTWQWLTEALLRDEVLDGEAVLQCF